MPGRSTSMRRSSSRSAALPGDQAAPPVVLQCVAVFASRERVRAVIRGAFPRRRSRVVVSRTPAEFERTFRESLIDAAVVDVGGAGEDCWEAARLAREFPGIPFFGLSPLRTVDGPVLSRCASLDMMDVLCDGVDDGAMRELVLARGFTARFAAAFREPPPSLSITGTLQRRAWDGVVARAGRAVRTDTIAESLGITREHLSRSFSAGGAPNLKRVIDLVRLIAAAELAKNPGYDVGDVARILAFASSSHLSSTAQRVVGTRPASLARLRSIDLLNRFSRGRARSRT